MELNILGITVIALLAALIGAVIKKSNPDMKLLLSLAAVTVMLIAVISKSAPLITSLKGYISNARVNSEYMAILFKAVGITILGQVVSSICKDAGETAISNTVDTATKIAVLISALPVLEDIMALLSDILT